MKTLLPCALLGAILLAQNSLAQSKTKPPPFPGWANKSTPGATTTAASTDIKDLLGQWEGALMNGDGSNPGQRQMNMSLTITPDKISSTGQGSLGEGTYKISGGSGAVRHIDAKGASGQIGRAHV